MLYFDLLPTDIIIYHIITKFNTAEQYTFYKSLNIDVPLDVEYIDICSVDMDYIKYFLEENLIDMSGAIEYSAYNGNIKILAEYSTYPPTNFWKHVVTGAIRGNHPEILEWIKSFNVEIDVDDAIILTLSAGHMNIMNYLFDTYTHDRVDHIICSNITDASRNGHLDIIKSVEHLLHEYHYGKIFLYAIYENRVNIVRWLVFSSRIPKIIGICDIPAKHNRLDIIKILVENGYPLGDSAIFAGYHGYLEVLEYCHLNGAVLNEDVFTDTVNGDNVPCLTYLHENKCPVNHQDVWDTLVEQDSEGSLKFLHENGYSLPSDICDQVRKRRSFGCIIYLIRVEYPGYENLITDIVDYCLSI